MGVLALKKIIKGKMYDTQTAKELGNWANGGNWRDFSHCEETLYQKRTGEFFLLGEGGPMTKYAVSQGCNSWSGGTEIIPLTWETAREWAEEHLDADEYESIFGEVSEDESRTVVTISLAVSTLEKAKREAAKQGISLSSYVESLLQIAE